MRKSKKILSKLSRRVTGWEFLLKTGGNQVDNKTIAQQYTRYHHTKPGSQNLKKS